MYRNIGRNDLSKLMMQEWVCVWSFDDDVAVVLNLLI